MIFSRIGRKPRQDIKTMSVLFPAAEAAARADGLDVAGAEYLLVAALDLEDGSARRAFERVGADPDDFPAAIRGQHDAALQQAGMVGIDDTALDQHLPEPTQPIGPTRTAPSAHQMFRSVVKAVRRDASQLYSAYFVLAATETNYGTTIRAIRHLGIDPADLAEAARAEIEALLE
jgi:hypothetical protein